MTEAPVLEAPAEPKVPTKPLMDSSLPMASQANKLIKHLEQDKPADEEKKKDPEEPKKDDPEKPADEEKVVPPDDEEDEPEQPKPVDLGPVGKYILDKLPTLTTRIKVGDSVKTISFKDTAELPEGFELADDSARAQFTIDVANQVSRAKDALNEYKNQEMQENIRKFEVQEAQDVADDISWLQKRDYLPKFQYAEDDPKFNSDPAVKTANEIYGLYKKTNDAYARKFANTGRTYRISYRDAADKYFAAQSRVVADDSQKGKEQPKDTKPKNPQAQKEREQIARQQGAPAGGEPTGNRPRPKSGMTMADINRLYTAGKL